MKKTQVYKNQQQMLEGIEDDLLTKANPKQPRSNTLEQEQPSLSPDLKGIPRYYAIL